MSLDRYRTFWAVAEAGSFTKAANALFLSQPAVSQAVKKLEIDMGTRLFLRSSRGVVLTAEGSVLYAHIREAFHLIEAGERRLEAMRRLDAGEIRVGSSDTLCQYVLLPALDRFHRRYPAIRIHVTNGTSSETMALLQSGRIDFGLVNLPVPDAGLIVRPGPILREGFVAGPHYRELAERRLSLAEAAALPLILLDSESVTRGDLDEFFRGRGLTLRPAIELGSHDLMVEFAKIGLGVAHVVLSFVAPALLDGSLYEIQTTPPLPERHTGLVLPSDGPQSTAVETLLDDLAASGLTHGGES